MVRTFGTIVAVDTAANSFEVALVSVPGRGASRSLVIGGLPRGAVQALAADFAEGRTEMVEVTMP